MAERAQELRSKKRLSRRRLLSLADKTRELNAREEVTTRRGSKRLRGLLEARRAQELAEARKRLRLREEARAEANAITEQAEEEAKGIAVRAKAKAFAMMAQVLWKIPPITR